MYKVDQVETLFNCDLCSKTYVSPVTLPCGSTLCISHLDTYVEKERFRCALCHEEHSVPKNGFKTNKNLQNALDLQLNKAFKTSPVLEECKKHIENAGAIICQMELLMNSPESYLYDYFEEIIRQVDLRRENLKQEVDECSDLIIEEVKNTRTECMKISAGIQKISQDIETSSQALNRLKAEFDTLHIKEAKLNAVKRELVDLECKLDERLIKSQERVRGQLEYSFDYCEAGIKNVFGKIVRRSILVEGINSTHIYRQLNLEYIPENTFT